DDDVICRVYDLQARALFTVHGMSSILVDVTTQAKAIASQHPPIAQSSTFLASTVRVLDPAGIPVVDARRVKCLGTNTINYGDLEGAIDVSAVGHLVEPGQLRAIAHVLRGNLANDMNGRRSISVREMLLTARRSYGEALLICFRGRAFSAVLDITSFVAGVIILCVFIHATFTPVVSATEIPMLMVGYGFGASFVALFMQLGGGIYTKAADVGADFVGNSRRRG
ncbi:hypothetical protein DYB26_013922, partial [Aphanomyces astaci]